MFLCLKRTLILVSISLRMSVQGVAEKFERSACLFERTICLFLSRLSNVSRGERRD